MTEIKPSRLYSFLDDKENYVISFLEGQRVILDSALNLGYSQFDLAFFRAAFLCAAHVIQFFKNNESLGFYIDAEDPAFHFKLEANSQGYVRALKVPEDARLISEKISGVARFTKTATYQKEPYQSVILVKEQTLEAIVNQILEQSFQIAAQVYVSQSSDQSVMVSKLPSKEGEEVKQPKEYLLENKKLYLDIFSKSYNEEAPLIAAFEQAGLRYLSSTELKLYCPCSKETIIVGLGPILKDELKELEQVGQKEVEITCQYCKKVYKISRADMKSVTIN